MRPERHPGRRLPPLVAALLLVAVAVLPHLHGLGAFFVGDDFDFLVRVQRMEGAADVLRMSFWGEWEPLWHLGFYRDYRLWGLHAAGFHLSSLLWHVLGVVALFGFVREAWPESRQAAWAAALLFAVHPLHDEAITYIAARGHPMATGLAITALWAYVRMRRQRTPGRRIFWLAAALAVALAAGLAKETALCLAAWIAVLEWGVFGRLRPEPAAVGRAVAAGAAFLLPAAGYLALRHLAVGLGSGKLSGPDNGIADLAGACLRFLPEYALVGGLPFPFAFLDREVVVGWRPLGWVVLAAVGAALCVGLFRAWCRPGDGSRRAGILLLGLVIVVVSLLPVFWADLAVKRRYFYMPAVGASLAAAAALQWVAARRPRASTWLLAGLVAAGVLGLVHRNTLYRQAGAITRDLLVEARGAPLGQPLPRPPGAGRRVVLLSLPRYLAGDGLSGAYVLHSTDARSLFRLAGGRLLHYAQGVECHHADDYPSEIAFRGPERLSLQVRFRTRRAYEDARRRDPGEDVKGRLVRVAGAAFDDAARFVEYDVLLAPGFFRDPHNELYLYDDGRFRRVEPNR